LILIKGQAVALPLTAIANITHNTPVQLRTITSCPGALLRKSNLEIVYKQAELPRKTTLQGFVAPADKAEYLHNPS
jgi:hypothetical protein